MGTRILNELASHVGGRVIGDPEIPISSASTLELAQPGQITFLANSRYAPLVARTRASAILVAQPMEAPAAQVVVEDPYYAFSQILVLLHGHRQQRPVGISAKAVIDATATVGPDTHIHEGVTISERAQIGRGCVLYPGVFIGPDVKTGDECVFYPNVVIYDFVQIGSRVTIHANTTIGQDGLGYATHKGLHYKIPHIARVIVEDDVEIGANAGIERGTLQDTVIQRGSKLGSQVVIGHGVQLGHDCMMVAQTGIAGSTRIGHHALMAGQVGIAGHLNIGNNVTIAAKSGVHQDAGDGERLFGMPAFDMTKAVEAYSLIKRLPELRKKIRELETRLAALEKGHFR
jgi:UDP-3-O-[3-hydroxymyristoyl] glucosamine N-acyltransferase